MNDFWTFGTNLKSNAKINEDFLIIIIMKYNILILISEHSETEVKYFLCTNTPYITINCTSCIAQEYNNIFSKSDLFT